MAHIKAQDDNDGDDDRADDAQLGVRLVESRLPKYANIQCMPPVAKKPSAAVHSTAMEEWQF